MHILQTGVYTADSVDCRQYTRFTVWQMLLVLLWLKKYFSQCLYYSNNIREYPELFISNFN